MHSPSHLELPFKPTPATQPAAHRRTLLVVDDEEGPRQSLRIVFKDDYHILLADDPAKAIELARKHRIDAAVLDIRMCGMSGIELLEKLKAIDPAIEVIMLTAYETIETARQALRFGACDYLNKPFDVSTMRAAVATAMERRSLSDDIRSNNQRLEELRSEIRKQQLQQEIARNQGEIYASIIHDMNGPLTIISGFIEMIDQRIGKAERVEGQDLDNVKDRLSRITRQVSNCIDISRRYLRFLREANSENPTVEVGQIFEDFGHLIRAHPSLQENQLIIRPVAETALARINGTDLLQILLNLTVNALQAGAHPHVVEISASLLDQPLAAAALQDGPCDRFVNREGFLNATPLFALQVKDDGPGISSELLPKVFETFFTTKADGHGSGLGLSIVLRLVKRAGGGIHLHSRPGVGTFFTVYIPAVAAPAQSSASLK